MLHMYIIYVYYIFNICNLLFVLFLCRIMIVCVCVCVCVYMKRGRERKYRGFVYRIMKAGRPQNLHFAIHRPRRCDGIALVGI